MQQWLLPLLALVTAHLVAVVSPGPSFLVVVQTAAGSSRRAGMVAALAMGLGAVLWAAAALLGVAAVFARFATLYRVAQVAGGLFLVYVAWQIGRHAAAPLPEPGTAPVQSLWRTFTSALRVQMSNPKVAVFFGSIFVTVLPRETPGWFKLTVLAFILLDEFLWYAFVAWALSTGHSRRAYARFKTRVDRVTAAFLGLLGLRLVYEAAVEESTAR